MGKTIKKASLRQLERDNETLALIVRGNIVTAQRQARKIAKLTQDNRNLRKRRGRWFRLKAWLRRKT